MGFLDLGGLKNRGYWGQKRCFLQFLYFFAFIIGFLAKLVCFLIRVVCFLMFFDHRLRRLTRIFTTRGVCTNFSNKWNYGFHGYPGHKFHRFFLATNYTNDHEFFYRGGRGVRGVSQLIVLSAIETARSTLLPVQPPRSRLLCNHW